MLNSSSGFSATFVCQQTFLSTRYWTAIVIKELVSLFFSAIFSVSKVSSLQIFQYLLFFVLTVISFCFLVLLYIIFLFLIQLCISSTNLICSTGLMIQLVTIYFDSCLTLSRMAIKFYISGGAMGATCVAIIYGNKNLSDMSWRNVIPKQLRPRNGKRCYPRR